MIGLTFFYILTVVVLIRTSYAADRAVREMMEITARDGSHPTRIELTLKIKQRQKWIDALAAIISVIGCAHVLSLVSQP